MPLFEKDDEAHVWLVRRPETKRSHGGQVAFAGGKSDPNDASRCMTAWREAEEAMRLGSAAREESRRGAEDAERKME